LKEQTIERESVDDPYLNKGKTTIAPEVLLTIAQLTSLEVPGVSRMGSIPASVDRLFQRGYGSGVRIDIREDLVYIDLHLVLCKEVNIRDVSRQVQHNVARAISEMVGMQVGRVNVHIEDIDYNAEPEKSQPAED
jgi:uncharacterized alkaline shock family protein YloU